ncbi:uncharacterized protein LOC107414847 isoform X4 [Ziziphus jujuba]|uniref:Uncharacterized protein LOC107414847 isoform X4 n=1 Tax=Ziziphus jujuba TaxID=326968 RepID=A0A6P3ZJA6_ZIZJJ|nr:uncharacterized protein LOC107414847 isoform X4 [Ziziphus jujuba]
MESSDTDTDIITTHKKWHPDKHMGDSNVTSKFQEISEAYKVLIDPAKRIEYDLTGIYEIDKYSLREYLGRFKGMILTCNGLGIDHNTSACCRNRQLVRLGSNEYEDKYK